MKCHRSAYAHVIARIVTCFVVSQGNAAALADRVAETSPRADYTATDRLIVRFKDGVAPGTTATNASAPQTAAKGTPQSAVQTKLLLSEQAANRQQVAMRLQALTTETLTPLRTMADGSHVIRLSRRLPISAVDAIAARLAQDPEVLEVLPDRLYFPAATPTDPQYGNQWNLSAANGINMPGAWDITTGSSSLVIAILDTGILNHADLAGRIVPGYDFISNIDKPHSNDGDGRDADFNDPGDYLTDNTGLFAGCPVVTESSWHGTAMAGVIAANANNATGIAGINWNSKILPVRVMGKCGGYESDIIDGLLWAVGLYSIPGVGLNPNVAKVVNMSLTTAGQGAGATCSSVLQNAITSVIDAGVPVVAAAGNQGADAGAYSPGNCDGVITVGAVDKNGGKPTYTNFGSKVVISAPGGFNTDEGVLLSAPGTAMRPETSQVWTTSDSGTNGPANDSSYKTTFGTSVAAAQVTGIVSLIRSINPQLTPQIIKEILQNTSRTFPAGTTAIMPTPSQADCSVANCGTGIPHAALAIQGAQRWGRATPQVGGGGSTDFGGGVGLRSDGQAFQWGSTPVPVAGINGIVKLATQAYFTLALRADGTVWAWGLGPLGDGVTTSSSMPVRALITGVTDIASGEYLSLALKSDGTVWGWGNGSNGELGSGTTSPNNLTPILVAGISNVISVAGGSHHALGLKGDGTVWAWGNNGSGQLGDGTQTSRSIPVLVPVLSDVIKIAAGTYSSYALKSDGTVWAWGYNGAGQLGDGTTAQRLAPVKVTGLAGVTAIAASSGRHVLALKGDRTVWAWGDNSYGQLGRGSELPYFDGVATSVQGLTGVTAIGVGDIQSFAIKSDGTAVGWGGNYNGQLGIGNTISPQLLPVTVLGVGGLGALNLDLSVSLFTPQVNVPPLGVRQSNTIIVTGIANGSAISVTGGSYQIDTGAFNTTAGTINNDQSVTLSQTASSLCNTTTTATVTIGGVARSFSLTTSACDFTPNPFTFVSQGNLSRSASVMSNIATITGIIGATQISVIGADYSIGCNGIFTTAVGTINNNQTVCVRQTASATYDTVTTATLTVGTFTTPFYVMTQAAPAFTATPQITGGGAGIGGVGLRSDGLVFNWRQGTAKMPTQVGISGVVKLAVGGTIGGGFALALRADGSVWTWGSGGNGQLGDGLAATSVTPVRALITGVTAIACGSSHALALKGDGTVWGWGQGDNGELGSGTASYINPTPVQVAGISNAIAVAGGYEHSLLLKNDGTVWAWGRNTFGQLGNGAVTSSTSPPASVGGLTGVIKITAGAYSSYALKSDGTIWAWGHNGAGQLGDGTTAQRLTPVQVTGLTGMTAIAASSGGHVLALKGDRTVWAWGNNQYAQLGNGVSPYPHAIATPAQVQGLTDVTTIGVGPSQSYATKSDGSVTGWGDNQFAQLGIGNTISPQLLPVTVLGVGGLGTLNLDLSVSLFTPQVNVPPLGVRQSNTIIVTGIANGSAISVTGGSYQIDTGAFNTTAGTINNGQSGTLSQTASSLCNTTTTATVTIGGVARSFSLTTSACVAPDITPNVFSFVTQANIVRSASVVSNSVIITGIDAATPISITGGDYSINCTATFTNTVGTISNSQTVCMRQTAAATYDTVTTATLTVGSVSVPFRLITQTLPTFTTSAQITGDGATGSGPIAGGVGLRSDGLVFDWPPLTIIGPMGPGLPGQYTGEPTPRQKAGISGVVKLVTGGGVTTTLRVDRTVWAWGPGNLGDGLPTSSVTPVQALIKDVTDIADGNYHKLASKSDGTVWGWGAGSGGQLGSGTTSAQNLTPQQVVGISNAIAVAAGPGTMFPQSHSLALAIDGTVWAWGDNEYGQLGNGMVSSTFISAPTPVLGLAGVIKIAAARSSSYALKSDGTVWAWGYNDNGRLGDGTATNRAAPVQVATLSGVTAIAASIGGHVLALRGDGTVWAWGGNGVGQLGNGTMSLRNVTPVQVAGLTGVTAIGVGNSHSYAINPDGSVVGWGSNGLGQLGIGNFITPQPLPVRTLGPLGDGFLVLQLNRTAPYIFTFLPDFGVTRSTVIASSPIGVSGLGSGVLSPITIVGGSYSINNGPSTSASGTVANNDSVVVSVQSSASYSTTTSATLTIGGTFGRSSTFYVRTRRDPSITAIIPQMALGNSHSYILNADATVYAVGYNGNGQLGTGTTFGTSVLRPVSGIAKVISVASGAYHGLALRDDGNGTTSVLSWGYNAGGQLGSGIDTNSELNTVNVVGLTGVSAISAGDYHSLALKQDGTVWAWGLNVDGQIGQGNIATSRYLTPIQVMGLSGVTAIAAGGRHNLAVLANGSVVAWGSNTSGQLGDGTLISRLSPVPVSSLASGVLSVDAGGTHSLALKTDSTAFAWGNNDFGQLGDGSNTTRTSPVPITALGTGVALLAAGTSHSLAVKVGGVLFSWGANTNSQLGDNALVGRNTPFQFTTITNVVAIAAGGRHSAALSTNKKLNIFGDNFFGQVGSKSGNYNPHSGSLNILRGDSQISQGITAASTSIGTAGFSGSALLELSGIAASIFFPRTAVNGSEITIGTFTNTSSADTYPSIGVTLPSGAPFFTLTNNQCTAAVIPQGKCTFEITFAPQAATSYGGSVTVTSPAGEQSLVLTGDGQATGPILALPGLPPDQSTLLFESVALGDQGPSQAIAVKNDGVAELHVNAIASTSDFQITGNTCESAIAPAGTCQVDVRFTPSGVGTRSLVLTLTSDGGDRTVTLSGTGVYSMNDTIPDGFTNFTAQTGVTPGTVLTSSTQTIAGINAPAQISVAGGSYSIGCTTTFINTASTITSGQTVCLRHTSSPSPTTSVTTTLTIGGVNGTFTSTTGLGSFLLSVSKTGAGGGTIASTLPASPTINCGATCSASFTAGTSVTLTATPTTASTFTGWSGGVCTGTGSCVVMMSAAKSVTATFAVSTYTVTPSSGANGTITPSGPQTIGHGGSVSFTVTPDPGYTASVTGSCAGTLVGTLFTTAAVTGNCNVFASFNLGLVLVAVQSRKTHGAAGPFDLPIDGSQNIGGAVTVESRVIGAGHQIVFQFNQPITSAGSASVGPVGAATATFAGTEVTVTLTGVPDNRRVTVSLTNVNGSLSPQVALGFLAGDVNGSRSVNSSDISGVKARSGQVTTLTNFKFDVNASGGINSSDISAVKARSGLVLP